MRKVFTLPQSLGICPECGYPVRLQFDDSGELLIDCVNADIDDDPNIDVHQWETEVWEKIDQTVMAYVERAIGEYGDRVRRIPPGPSPIVRVQKSIPAGSNGGMRRVKQ